MNVLERAQTGYAAAAIPLRSDRATEYDAIGKISHRLRSAAGKRHQDWPAFVKALSDNRRLWSTLAVDVAQAENELPDDLRARLFWLAEFVDAESRKILRNSGDISVLIEINAAVMQGLRGQEVA